MSSKIQIKICGINSNQSAEACNGADFIGFVFYQKSPRFVTAFEAKEISKYLQTNLKKVGLFVNSEINLIKHISEFVNLDIIQLHGTETIKNIQQIKRSIYTGNPVRKEFYEIGKIKYLPPAKKNFFYILIYGGSLGSKFFSEYLPSIICSLPKGMKEKIKIIQQVRKEDLKLVRKNYKLNKIDAEISIFFQDVSEKFKISHLIITRSGGSSVAEVLASNRPVIFIPLPTSLDNHQYENARFLERNKGGWLIDQNNKTINELERLIKHLLQNPKNLVEASNQLKKLASRLEKLRNNKTPTEFLSECILKLINDKKKVVPTIC
mgnify:CR=1 FL=1